MPIKVRLPNGEVAQFPDGMSEDEIAKAIEDSGLGQPPKPPPAKHGALYAAGTSALKSVLPSAAAFAGAVAGGEAAASSGIGWLGGPAGELIATGAGAILGGTLAELGQHKLMKVAVPDFLKESEQAESEHEPASFVGGVLGAAPTFGLSPGTTLVKGLSKIPGYASRLEPEKKLVKDAVSLLGMGAGLGIVSPLAQGALQGQFTPPTVKGVAENIGAMALLGRPTRLAREFIGRPIANLRGRATTTGVTDATQERVQQEGSQPERPGTPPLGVSPEAGGGNRPAPAAGLEKEAQVPLETPIITGSDKFGWTVRIGTRTEGGFESKKAAQDRAAEALGGEKPLRYEVTPEDLTAEEEELKKKSAEADKIYDQTERAAIDSAGDLKVDLSSQKSATGGGEDVPFSGGEFFKALGGNKVAWNKEAFRDWVINDLYEQGLSREQIMKAVRARVREELYHNKFEGLFTSDQWKQYWDSLSLFEKRKVIKQYTGRWNMRLDPETGKPRVSDVQLAKEAFRQRYERYQNVTQSDIEQEQLTERWSLQGLDILSNMILKARERLGTEGGKYSRDMWDRALKGVEASKELAREMPPSPPEDLPGATGKAREEELLIPRGQFTTRMWMRPDGQLIRVNHLHAVTAQEITGIKDGFEALQALRKRGYVHLRIQPEGFYVGNEPNAKQLKELKDLSIENGFRLISPLGHEYPAARGKRQKDTDRPDEPMLIPGLTEKGEQAGVGEAPQPVAPEERIVNIIPPTQEQIDAAGRPPPSDMEVSRILTPIVTGEHPDYDLFKDQLRKQFGPRWTNEVAPGAFEDGIWYALTHSAPEKIAQWIGEFKVGARLGLKRVPRIKEEDIQRVNDPEVRAQMRKQMELLKGTPTKLAPETMETLVNRLRTNARFRNTAISTLAREMLKDVVFREQPRYRAKSIEFEDIDFDNPKTDWPGYYEFSPGEASSPTILNDIIKTRARAGSYAPVSASNRLVVLRNRLNGEIEVVSAYEHGRDGVVVFRPRLNKYVPIKEVDPNRRFYATILRKEPLQRFEQYFKNTDEFHKHIDRNNALASSQPREEEGPQRMARRIEGSEGIEPSAGVTGPEAELVRLAQGEGTGELLKAIQGSEPLLGSEAAGLHSVMEEMRVRNIADFEEMLKKLDQMAQTKELQGRHYQAYSALFKMAGAIMRSAPPETVGPQRQPLTPDQIHALTTQAALESFKSAKSKEAFVIDTLLNYGWEPTRLGEPANAPVRPSAPPTTGARELALPRFVGRPIEQVGQRLMPFEGAAQAPEMTFANPGSVSGPEMLPLDVQRAMEKLPEGFTSGVTPEEPVKGIDITKLKPTGKITEYPPPEFRTKSGYLGPTRTTAPRVMPTVEKTGQRKLDLPAASRKYAEEYTDEIKRYGQLIRIANTRRMTDRDIRALADGSQRTAEAHSIREANTIRWASVGKDKVSGFWERHGFTSLFDRPEALKIRKAVAPYYAAMQIAELEEWERVRRAWVDLRDQESSLMDAHKAVPDRAPGNTLWERTQHVQPKAPSAGHFEKLILQARKGMERAEGMLKSPNVKTRLDGKKYLDGAKELMDLAIYARDNLANPRLRKTAEQFRKVMNDQLELMNLNGMNIASREHYVPTIYDGEVWDDGMMTWGDNRYLGTQHRMPKVFENYYDAIEAGPYIPVNLDSAVLAQHSVVKSTRQINKMLWGDLLKGTIDPESNKPVAMSAVWAKVNPTAEELAALHERIERSVEEEIKANPEKYPNPETQKDAYDFIKAQLHEIAQRTLKQKYTWQVPAKAKEYDLVQLGGKAAPIAVRRSYAKTVEAMLSESKVPELPLGRQALLASQMLKHGVVLLLDTFHPGRLFQYATSLGGKNWLGFRGRPGWKSGWSALTWHPEDLPKAVEAGLIPKESADWAMEKIKVYDRGTIKELTRHQLGDIFLSQGLNATQLADALYRSAVQRIPVIGEKWYKYGVSPFTKFTFDRFTPGLILESAIRNFERLNPGNPKTDFRRQVRDISRDVNAFYGNMGRQGIFKSATFRDLAQIFVLAPLWQEGLLRKELTTAMRLTGVSRALGRNTGSFESYLGPISFGVARGLGAYFVLTQLVNLVTKGHFTWDNKEKDHKMDAWFGIGDKGVWISPMSVFGEVTGEFLRLNETKGTTWEAATRLGFNKLGPLGRMFNILHDQKTPHGEAITSTAGTLGAAAGELMPLPISLGTAIKGAGATLGVPGATPNPPGAALQRGLSAVGVKSIRPTRPEQDVAQLADRFMKSSGKKFQPMEMLPTDSASYSKLRGAIRNKDFRGARNILSELRKSRTDKQIIHAMRLASTRPFTGSAAAEREFLYSLSNDQLDVYYKANLNRAQYYQDFLSWFISQ